MPTLAASDPPVHTTHRRAVFFAEFADALARDVAALEVEQNEMDRHRQQFVAEMVGGFNYAMRTAVRDQLAAEAKRAMASTIVAQGRPPAPPASPA